MGPQNPFSQQLHAEKYRGKGETFREFVNRLAGSLSDNQNEFRALQDIIGNQRFLPGGRIQSAIGSTRNVTALNCYCSGSISDSFVDGENCIMDIAKQAAATMRQGGGIGYSFGTLRPRGDLIKKLDSNSSGPVSFMMIFDAICRCVASSGHRRGAQMAVLPVSHPDVEEFIRAKHDKTSLTGFNVSVGITDEFMKCLCEKKPFPLTWEGKTYREVDPVALWDTLMRSTWDWSEPGVMFLDAINVNNNLSYCETIHTSNPCGEVPLPPHGACLLGSFNLTKYVRDGSFNWALFKRDIPYAVKALDNVIDQARYPLPEQEKEEKTKRRIGIGVTGLANALEYLGHPYGSEGFIKLQEDIFRTLRDECYRASVDLAKERGSFELLDREKHLERPFIQALPDDIKEGIKQFGIRNSHLLAVAPTGTISICADNVSSSIEPVFSYKTTRTVHTQGEVKQVEVNDYGYEVLGVKGKRCHEVTVDEHLAVLSTAQRYVDQAVSKTCNIGENTTFEEFKQVYIKAYDLGCKGCTTYRTNGKRNAVLVSADDDEGQACRIDPETGRRECD